MKKGFSFLLGWKWIFWTHLKFLSVTICVLRPNKHLRNSFVTLPSSVQLIKDDVATKVEQLLAGQRTICRSRPVWARPTHRAQQQRQGTLASSQHNLLNFVKKQKMFCFFLKKKKNGEKKGWNLWREIAAWIETQRAMMKSVKVKVSEALWVKVAIEGLCMEKEKERQFFYKKNPKCLTSVHKHIYPHTDTWTQHENKWHTCIDCVAIAAIRKSTTKVLSVLIFFSGIKKEIIISNFLVF